MRIWVEPPDVLVPDALQGALGRHPLVAKTLVRRGFADVTSALAFLDPDHYRPAPAADLPGLERAVERLHQAVQRGEPICVWGDFDVDGQTATALLTGTLQDLGGVVTYHVPVRATESHGVNVPVLTQLIDGGARVILTCDTGITAHEAVEVARARGVDVIVTDHHELPAAVPEAYALVNPKFLPQGHPLRTLPGVGVAYKVAERLYDRGTGAGASAAARHLDLVALGIVADLAVQTGDTRYLLQRGLAALRQTERPGLRLLMASAELDPTWLTEEHISYVLGPRLNAVGRLADANAAVELLLLTGREPAGLSAEVLARARILVAEMERLNAQRKLMCDQVYAAAEAQIARDPELARGAALVLASPAWPAGVIGIVASRLVERYGRPVVLIAAPPGQVARGSARSIDGIDITAAIATQAGLLESFGGHPMAAGLSILPERIPEFSRALARTVEAMLGAAEVVPRLAIDGYLGLGELSPELAEDLACLAPFGPGNPPLTLVSTGLRVEGQRTAGRDGEHRLVTVADAEGRQQQVIWWEGGSEELPEGTFDLAYTVRSSDYRGERRVEVVWLDARLATGVQVTSGRREQPHVEVLDYRGAGNPREILLELCRAGGVAVWREGAAAADLPGYDRYTLPPAETLAIWTVPPGPAELRAALARVSPSRLVLFGLDPGSDQPGVFMQRLAGLVKHALRARGGTTTVSALAAATAQREATVRAGLEWLAARGGLRVIQIWGDRVQLAEPERNGRGVAALADSQRAAERGARAQLEALLAETAAYRDYFGKAELAALHLSEAAGDA